KPNNSNALDTFSILKSLEMEIGHLKTFVHNYVNYNNTAKQAIHIYLCCYFGVFLPLLSSNHRGFCIACRL
ncbi:TPA: hypothetical protein ACGO6J_002415, partial [Streptococcus suis]